MLVVLSAEIPELQNNRIFEFAVARRYPGAGWAARLGRLCRSRGIPAATADVCQAKPPGKMDEVRVIQHALDPVTTALRRQGARSSLLLCMESPLYLPEVYDHYDETAASFENTMTFSRMSRPSPGGPRESLMRFPILTGEDGLRSGDDWAGREKVVLVAGNKYPLSCRPFSVRPRDGWYWLKGQKVKLRSAALRAAVSRQLLERRLEIVDALLDRQLLRVFGSGWDVPNDYPPRFRARMIARFHSRPAVRAGDKIATLAQYKFALCMENVAWPGYVTEKIVDAMAAGCVPLYLGAPDIGEFIPREAYVDLRAMSDEEIVDRVRGMDSREARRIVDAGRAYLRCPEGRLHFEEAFAEAVLAMIETEPARRAG